MYADTAREALVLASAIQDRVTLDSDLPVVIIASNPDVVFDALDEMMAGDLDEGIPDPSRLEVHASEPEVWVPARTIWLHGT